MNGRLTIGQLAEMSGVPSKTIRYYEEVGILPPPQRSGSGYRVYSDIDVRRVELIRRARALDMTLAEMRDLVGWAGSGTCNDFQDSFLGVVRRKLEEVDELTADLERLRQDLQHLEAHFLESKKEGRADHTMLECSPETCTCLGRTRDNREHRQEVKLWLNKSRP